MGVRHARKHNPHMRIVVAPQGGSCCLWYGRRDGGQGGGQCSGLIWYKILSAYDFWPFHTEIVTVLLTISAVGAGRNCKLTFFPGGKPPYRLDD